MLMLMFRTAVRDRYSNIHKYTHLIPTIYQNPPFFKKITNN